MPMKISVLPWSNTCVNLATTFSLHTEVSSHAGIIVCTRDDDVAALADRIHRQLQSTPILQGQLLRINRPSS